ncbi:aminopeptidase P family protein [Orrella sp. JC864]|uniref:aminopeptidase P family protein n=1 Tax=Orrella sp. JC864 TaxID=3120298 RepID=UPI00300BB8A2
MNAIADRIARLRDVLRAEGLYACIIPTADPHLSEYLPAHWQGRQWLSGFTGSAGTLVVALEQAALWVDSRYWEQAQAQLAGTPIAMMKLQGAGGGHAEWLAQAAPKGARVAVDGWSVSVSGLRRLRETLQAAGVAVETGQDLLARIWDDRPALPDAPVYEHALEYACQPRADKLAQVRQAMAELGARWHLLSSLDDIAWLFNLRGADVDYNPVFLAHALIGPDQARLFVAPDKIDPALQAELARDAVTVQGYGEIGGALACLPETDVLLIDPARVSAGLLEAAAFVQKTESLNPSQWLKARKSEAQAAHVRRAMAEDGAALCEFFAWFEQALAQGQPLTELDIDAQLIACRSRRARYVSPSFPTIAAFNANGAMPHYRAVPESHARIEGDGLLLIDSGGQYLDGTTDITRVVPVGTVLPEQKRDYTRVLQGMIALSRAVFPAGLHAGALDALARAPIWQGGADFGHGTGHGVGYFLNVHEGPQGISHRAPQGPHSGMQAGMITSNEPGLYRPGRWGIRIENLVLAVPAETTEFGDFLRFETLTLCPIDTRCVDRGLMRPDEIAWLDAYHRQVRERLAPLVSGPALAWLHRRTEPL